jgi:hypothetical protein
MTPEHFKEYLYTITLTTKSDKWDICRHLNVSKVTLNKWLRYGLPDSKKFLVLDKLEEYLFANFGGCKSEYHSATS